MLKKNIKYVDFNGIERDEDFYFHLSTPELTRMEAKYGGDIFEHIMHTVDNEDFMGMVSVLEDLILSSVGEKTTDGRSFMKSKEIRDKFENSQAYAELFEEIFTDPEASRAFGEGIVTPASPNEEKQRQIKQLRNSAK